MSTVSTSLYIFPEKSALHSCQVELFMEEEAKARGPNLHLLGWGFVHTVHVSEFLFTQAVVLVVICMLKN